MKGQRMQSIPSRVVYDAILKVYRVFWRGDLMQPRFETRHAALQYLGALRGGLTVGVFADTNDPIIQ
jgi:hypothetical protein